jgi:hypothetical protein
MLVDDGASEGRLGRYGHPRMVLAAVVRAMSALVGIAPASEWTQADVRAGRRSLGLVDTSLLILRSGQVRSFKFYVCALSGDTNHLTE